MAMMKAKSRQQAVAGALALAQKVGQFPASKLWLDHDVEADTIELDDGGILLHYRGKELVGITVLEASRR
jgi:hypothetical protein